MPKLSPLGHSDFKEIIADKRYYVDKTAMIRAVWEGSKVQHIFMNVAEKFDIVRGNLDASVSIPEGVVYAKGLKNEKK